MVNPQLLQYVRAQRTAGVSKEDIIKALSGGGWSASDSQEAFAAVEGPPPAPLAPKPPMTPPAQVQTPAMSTMSPAMQPRPVAVTSTMQQPMGVRPQPAAVVQQRPAYAPQVNRRARWPWVLLGLITFFILGMGAGAYLAVTNEFVSTTVMTLAGVEPAPVEESSFNQVANEGDTGGFLEVSPDPFDTMPTEEENSTSTPGTATSTPSTATSSSSGL